MVSSSSLQPHTSALIIAKVSFDLILGTYFLAQKYLEALEINSSKVLSQRLKTLISIAALCHDLGHGPFSHTFEQFVKTKLDKSWHHEDQSVRALDSIIDSQHLDITKSEFNFIVSLILDQKSQSHVKEQGINTSHRLDL